MATPAPGDGDGEESSEIMGRLQAGDDRALEELMARWQRPVANFIFRYVGSEVEALDLAQETFVRVYEHRDRYQAQGKFSAWLFSIAANLCRNHARWRSRHPTVPLESNVQDGERSTSFLGETLPDSARSPSEDLQAAESAAAVREAVQALPHDLKTVVLLYEYEDQSYRDIAKSLDCSEKSVETRLYRARQVLRKQLARSVSLGR